MMREVLHSWIAGCAFARVGSDATRCVRWAAEVERRRLFTHQRVPTCIEVIDWYLFPY